MKLNWNFPGGGGGGVGDGGEGVQNKKPSMVEYGYFLELHVFYLVYFMS